jgi:DNA polymerase-3 subunit epsilon
MFSADRKEVVNQTRLLVARQPLYLDTETTGIGPQSEIIEVAVVDHDGGLLFSSLVKPHGQIEPDAFKVHGITPEMVQDAPSWPEVWELLMPILLNHVIGTYNSDFDLRMLRQTHQKYWLNWNLADESFFCIMKLYARFAGQWDSRRGSYRWHSLEQAGRDCRIPLPNAHRASDDAQLARAVMMHMANEFVERLS